MNDQTDRIKATRRATRAPYNQLKADLGFDEGDHLDMDKFWMAAQQCRLSRQAKHRVYRSLRMRYNSDGSINHTLKEIGEALPIYGKYGVSRAITPQAVNGIMTRCRRRMRHPDMLKLYMEEQNE